MGTLKLGRPQGTLSPVVWVESCDTAYTAGVSRQHRRSHDDISAAFPGLDDYLSSLACSAISDTSQLSHQPAGYVCKAVKKSNFPPFRFHVFALVKADPPRHHLHVCVALLYTHLLF